MSVVLLVRHAQASFGARSYDRLSGLGAAQAEHLGEVLAARGTVVDRIVTGRMRRQRDTAAAIARAVHARAEVDPRWDEYDYRALVARVRPSYRHHWLMVADLVRRGDPARGLQQVLDEALAAWVAADDGREDHSGVAPAADTADESFAEYCRRADAALADAAAGQGTTLVVSSAGTIAAALLPLLGTPPAAWPRLQRTAINTAVTKVVSGRSGLSVISFNEHGHLEGVDGLSVTYR